MITEILKEQPKIVDFLRKFQEKTGATLDELKQIVGYALEVVSAPPIATEVLTPKGEELRQKELDKKGQKGAINTGEPVKVTEHQKKSPATDLK